MSNKVLPVGILKEFLADFVVNEIARDRAGNPSITKISTESIIEGYDSRYPVTVFCMSKFRLETKRALQEAARLLEVPEQNMGCQGLKDKHGHTSQLISVRGEFNPDFHHDNIALEQLYGQYNDLERGQLWGNHFEINIRSDAVNLDLTAAKRVLNLFGPQRLGQPGSQEIGRFLLEGKFDEAVQLLLAGRMSRRDLENSRRISGGTWIDALLHSSYRHYFGFEVEKWQSYLWNKLVQERFDASTLSEDERLLMWQPDRMVVEKYRHLWDPPQKLHPEALGELNMKPRRVFIRPENFRAKYKNGVWRFSFDLRPSMYATVVLSQLFQLEEKHDHR